MAQTHHIEDVGAILLSVQNDLKSLRSDLASVGGTDACKGSRRPPPPACPRAEVCAGTGKMLWEFTMLPFHHFAGSGGPRSHP